MNRREDWTPEDKLHNLAKLIVRIRIDVMSEAIQALKFMDEAEHLIRNDIADGETKYPGALMEFKHIRAFMEEMFELDKKHWFSQRPSNDEEE